MLDITGIEILAVGVILIFLFSYIGAFSFTKFVEDNNAVLGKLKEDDYDFYVISKYGDKADPNERYQKRVKNAIIVFIIGLVFMITSAVNLNFAIKLVIVFALTYLVFKDDYNKLKIAILFKEFRNINSTLYCSSSSNKKFRRSSRNV